MLSSSFDIQKFLRSLKEFEALPESDKPKIVSDTTLVPSNLLDPKKRIRSSISSTFSLILSEISNYAFAMNASISDTYLDDSFTLYGDDRFTPSTWGGRGDKINIDIKNCLSTLSNLLNPEISTFSSFNFSDKISNIIYSELFGRDFLVPEFTYADENTGIGLFGKFNKLFGFEIEYINWQFSQNGFTWENIKNQDGSNYSLDYFVITNPFTTLKLRVLVKYSTIDDPKITEFSNSDIILNNTLRVPDFLSGLSFLDKFSSLKSYNNKIYSVYKNGIEFRPPDLFSQSSLYQESFSNDSNYLSDYSLMISDKVRDVQICLDNILSNCDDFGRYSGYEGLGNIKGQILNLKKIFVPQYLNIFSDKIKSDLLKITSFSNSGSQDIFESLSSNLLDLSSNLDSLCSSLIRIGSRDGEKVTDRSYIYGSNTRDEIVYQLNKLGFNPQQINAVLSSQQLSCSFVFLYDDLDEKDIYSYFKGGRLAEYIFYLGGEKAIVDTLNFLISPTNLKYFIQLLKKLEKNRDVSISKNKYIYGNVLGSFISIFPEVINYLVGPDYKKYQLEIVTNLITSGKISLSSTQLLDRVSKNIPDGITDIGFNEAQNYSIIIKQFVDLLIPAIDDLQSQYKNTQFLSSINGLSAKELNLILNNTGGRRNYELSGFLSGIEGGRYQSLISGLIHAVLLPKTSPALLPANRRSFTLGEIKKNTSIEELIFKIKNISADLRDLSNMLIGLSSNDKILNPNPQLLKSTIYSINKDISYSIRNLSEGNNQQFIQELQKALDIEKPGIGNSRPIDSSQKRGILTPAQSREIETLLGITTSTTSVNNSISYDKKYILQKDILSKWIKLDFSSLQSLSGVVQIDQEIQNYTDPTSQEFENIKLKLTELISDGYINQPKTQYFNSVLGATSNKINIDEVGICSKLGKSKDICSAEYSLKSPISSNFGSTIYPSSIPVERPLGVLAEDYGSYSKAPGPLLLQNLSNGKINAKDLDVPSTTEYISTIDVLPSISFNKGFDNREIYNTEEKSILAGLFDLSNNHLYIQKYAKTSKSNIYDCRLITDPIERQLCLNYIKCTKFKPNKDVKYLNYCPSSTPGGRYKNL